jgi:hypothetical protein
MQTIEVSRRSFGLVAAGAVLALLMSGLALLQSFDDEDEYRRSVEQRLVCLELPGPNDCGADGR